MINPERYRPRPVLGELGAIALPVQPADFRGLRLRHRNQELAGRIGLGRLDYAAWIEHFGRFRPFPGNLARPLALAYGGHQLRVFNPNLGDGRGFVLAQLEDPETGRLLDLATKGSGTTPFSRDLDGRLSLEGALRELLASEMLDALGVPTCRVLSVIETDERVYRAGRSGPQRTAVLVRVCHGLLRIGSVERLAHLGDAQGMARLVRYFSRHYLPEGSGDAIALLAHASARLAELVAAWMVAGFAHGVLNTDNLSLTGEGLDYGPCRFLEVYDPEVAPAPFDDQRLYAFGRQPLEMLFGLGCLARALALLAPIEALTPALDAFAPAYRRALGAQVVRRLGLEPKGEAADAGLAEALLGALAERRLPIVPFFAAAYGRGRAGAEDAAGAEIARLLAGRRPAPRARPEDAAALRVALGEADIEEVLQAIERRDDWGPLRARLAEIAAMARVRRAG